MNINWNYHIHTSYTHGKNSVAEIAEYCKKLGIEEIAITEHVHSGLSYKFEKLRFDILRAAQKYEINILTGVEAKILPNGLLDAPADILSKVDVIIGSIHGWPKNISLDHAYELLAKSPATIIGHPQIINAEIIQSFIKHKKVIEISYKYPLSSVQLLLIQKFPGLRLSLGTDAHQLLDIKNAQDYFTKLIKKYNFSNRLWRIGDKI
jgi:histidinol phosphatase-like PHP family hydrolase